MPRVTVAGAGIAGLAVGSFLARAGFEVDIRERSEAPSADGAGIQLSPNACHVLHALGILDAVRAVAVAPSAVELQDGDRPLSRFELGERIERSGGAPYLVCARAGLRDALLDALPAAAAVSYGSPFAATDGIVIGADGVGSVVRDLVPGAARPVDTGWTAWRRTTEAASGDTTRVLLSPDEHRVAYPLRSSLNEVWVRRSDCPAPGADWTPWPVLAVDPDGSWSHGSTVLIGDAAHAMPPYAAQGGAMALEDAAELAAALTASPDDPPAAFLRYEKARRPRIEAVACLTRANRRIYHLAGPMRHARNVAMRLAPQAVLQRRMAWVYGWKPPAGLEPGRAADLRSTSEPSR